MIAGTHARAHSDSPLCSKPIQKKQYAEAYSAQPLRRLYSVSAHAGEPDLDLGEDVAAFSEDVVSYCLEEPVYETWRIE